MGASLSDITPLSASAGVAAGVCAAGAGAGVIASNNIYKGSTGHNTFTGNGTPEIERGDIIFRPLDGVPGFANYCHYGVYVGKGEVIHFTTTGEKGSLEKVSLAIFKDGKQVGIQTDFSSHERNSKRDTAMKAIVIFYDEEELNDWTTYDYMSNNCEHFANYCATGVKYSRQSNSKKKTIKIS